MEKNKLRKFADMEQLECVFQLSYNQIHAEGLTFELRGQWRERFFGNRNPIVLELGCGKGEYTVGLAQRFPDRNFIGVDIKGSRMWTGATQARDLGLRNAAFIRTSISEMPHFFAEAEVDEIWITFADPQMKKASKRLTSTTYMEIYRRILRPNGYINLKTDSLFLYTYTRLMAEHSHLCIDMAFGDLYAATLPDNMQSLTEIRTFYEQTWLSRGKQIKFLRFALNPDTRLEEPTEEIEKDNYSIKKL